jgi:hypothetical protein
VLWFGTEPKLRVLHRDPRFDALLRQMSPAMADRIASSHTTGHERAAAG